MASISGVPTIRSALLTTAGFTADGAILSAGIGVGAGVAGAAIMVTIVLHTLLRKPGLLAYGLVDLYYLSAQYARNIANTNAAANAANQAAMNSNQVVLNEQIKAEIKEQVEQAVRDHERKDQNAASLDAILANKKRIYVLHDDMSTTTANGRTVSLTEGDVLRAASAPSEDGTIQMEVVSAKRGQDGTVVPSGTQVTISLSDLQEIENEFRGRVEDGMKELEKIRARCKHRLTEAFVRTYLQTQLNRVFSVGEKDPVLFFGPETKTRAERNPKCSSLCLLLQITSALGIDHDFLAVALDESDHALRRLTGRHRFGIGEVDCKLDLVQLAQLRSTDQFALAIARSITKIDIGDVSRAALCEKTLRVRESRNRLATFAHTRI